MVEKAGLHGALRHRSATYWTLGVAIAVTGGGCVCGWHSSPRGTSPEAVRAAVLSGFERPPSRLFIDCDRTWRLVAGLGYDADKYSYRCDHSSDGTSLRCWNYDRSEAILITKDQCARAISVPPGSYLDDQDKVIASRDWYGHRECDHKITFRNGTELFAPGFHLEASGRLFCYGGNYYDYAAGVARELPVRIASVDNPRVPLATSEMKGLLGGIFATGKRVYLVFLWRDHVVCEEFAIDGGDLLQKRRFDIRPPVIIVGSVVATDFDPVSSSFLIYVARDLPLLGGPLWYVYDIKTGQFREIGVFEGYAGFLDRHLFDRTLEGLSNQPSQRK